MLVLSTGKSFDQIGDVAPRVRSLCQLFQVVKAGVVCGPRLDFFYNMVEDAPGLNTYLAKIYLVSFRNQLRHIDSPLYVSYLPERGVTILETAGLSFHVLFCSDLTLAGNILVQT